jgi:hypothetical protein
MTTAPFYALRVTHEARAAEDLAREGFECWSFTFKRYRAAAQWELRNVSGRTRVAMRQGSEYRAPLYPGYVFARIPAERFSEALELPRVFGVIRGAGDMPKPIPDGLIDEMVHEVLTCAHDEQVPRPPKNFGPEGRRMVIPKNKARSRKRRKGATQRLRRWIEETDHQHLARAA